MQLPDHLWESILVQGVLKTEENHSTLIPQKGEEPEGLQ